MNYILQEQKIDLQDTPIENIFITDFMPLANGTYVKVYLMGYKYATDKENNGSFNNSTIAKNLKIPLSDVLDAWSFWESQGVVKKHVTDDKYNYIVEFINLKQLYIDKVYKNLASTKENKLDVKENNILSPTITNDLSETGKELINSNKNLEFKQMNDEIDKIFGEPQNITCKKKILRWQREYELSPEMMVQAFSYCVNNKKIRRYSYIESIISLWHNENINTIDDLSEFLEKKEDRYYIYSRISKALGFNNRALTEGERKTIDKWVDDFGFSMDMILKCLDNSTKISSPNLSYFDAILQSWHEKGYKKPNDIVNIKRPVHKKDDNKKVINTKKKNKFHNFEQRTEQYTPEELKEIGRRNFEKKLKELGLNLQTEDIK